MASMFQKKPLIPPAPAGVFQYRDPMQQMGELERIQYMQQNNPEALMAIAGGLISGDVGAGFANAGQAMSAYRKEDYKRQEESAARDQAKSFYLSQGLSEAEANAAASNQNIGSSLLNRQELERRYELEAQNPDSADAFYSGQVDWGILPDGRSVPISLNKSTGRMERADGGDMSEIQQFLSPGEAARVRAVGKGAGEASLTLPRQELDAQITGELVDDILSDDKLIERNVGPMDAMTPSLRPSSRDWNLKVDQLLNRGWLDAYATLKGGGAITEAEGLKAAAAKIRDARGTDPAAFRNALLEFNENLKRGLQVLRQTATMNPNQNVGGAGGGVGGGGNRVRVVRDPATGRLTRQ